MNLIIGRRYTVYSRPSMTAHCTIRIRSSKDKRKWQQLIDAKTAELVELPKAK